MQLIFTLLCLAFSALSFPLPDSETTSETTDMLSTISCCHFIRLEYSSGQTCSYSKDSKGTIMGREKLNDEVFCLWYEQSKIYTPFLDGDGNQMNSTHACTNKKTPGMIQMHQEKC